MARHEAILSSVMARYEAIHGLPRRFAPRNDGGIAASLLSLRGTKQSMQ